MDLSNAENFFNGDLLKIARKIERNESNFDDVAKVWVSARGRDGVTLLMFAVINKKYDSILGLVRAGADVTMDVPKLGSPIRLAAISDDPRIMQAMLEGGVSPNTTLSGGTPILFSAVCEGHDQVVNELMKAGVNVNSISVTGNTVVHEALFCQKFERALKMLDLLEDPDAVNCQALSPADLATRFLNSPRIGAQHHEVLKAIIRKTRP